MSPVLSADIRVQWLTRVSRVVRPASIRVSRYGRSLAEHADHHVDVQHAGRLLHGHLHRPGLCRLQVELLQIHVA